MIFVLLKLVLTEGCKIDKSSRVELLVNAKQSFFVTQKFEINLFFELKTCPNKYDMEFVNYRVNFPKFRGNSRL